jgi:acyl-CoA hydrolase/GNAT superfamily N-acetyltransferase
VRRRSAVVAGRGEAAAGGIVVTAAPSSWLERQRDASSAIALVPRGKHVFVASGAAEPVSLVEELAAQADRFADNTVVHLLTLGPAPYTEPRYARAFRHNAIFIGPNVREAVDAGRADYTPVFLSQIPGLMRSRRLPIDVALIQVSPPDRFGYVNLGVSVDVVLAAVETARLVIAEVNPRMPVLHGDGFVHVDRIHAWVPVERPILAVPREAVDDTALEIGRHVAKLVEDRATLQVGIGGIPDAVLRALSNKKDLGVWSEMISDGVMDLVRNGNITGRHKTMDPGKVSASFTFGTQLLYDFVDDNPAFSFHASDRINDPMEVARQHRMVAINSALAVDLTGQVCADSIGARFYSGIGGQVDFIRGAGMCPGGKPIIAMRSTAKNGEVSRVVAALDAGAGVVTSRGDVRYVVTEHGVADLQGKSVRERAMALLALAHPDHRGELLERAKQRRYVFPDQPPPRARYPRAYERDILSIDGQKVLVRPVRITDEPRLRDLFYSLSEDTVYRRWLTVLKRLPRDELVREVDVDYDARMTLVVETRPDDREPELVAVGRYETDPAERNAEVAFVVRDDWQGRGLGTALLRQMVEIAGDHGVAALTADVLATNDAMLRVFHECGLEVVSTLEGTTYRLRVPIAPRTAGPVSVAP